jgi:hypothetical protein
MNARVVPIVILGALWLSAVPARADDDTPGYSMEDVTACSGDAMRLCKDKMPDVDAIESCMKARYEELTPKCKARFSR